MSSTANTRVMHPIAGSARWPLHVVCVALIGATTTGCYTTTLLPPQSLPYLAHNASPVADEPRALQDLDGKIVMIREPFSVQIDPLPDLPPVWARWAESTPPSESPLAVEIRGPMLVLQGRNDAGATQIPLAYVQRVRVRAYSPGKTAGLAVGVSLGGLTVVAGIAFIFIAQGLGSVR